MNTAIAGLTFYAARGTAAFRVVTNDRNACPRHSGVFLTRAAADAYCANDNAAAAEAGVLVPAVKVVPFTVR